MDPATRHRVMASIRGRDTRPELALRRALWRRGARGWRCHISVPGRPDIAFTRPMVAVFVDGVWWHGHPDYRPNGRRGPYWDQKIQRNYERDRGVDDQLRELGWEVQRYWDLDVLRDPDSVAEQIIDAVRRRRTLDSGRPR